MKRRCYLLRPKWRLLRCRVYERRRSQPVLPAPVPVMREPAFEPLNKRILFTSVTDVDPAANSHTASRTTNIEATFDQAINTGSVSD